MSLKIHAISALSDNYVWLLQFDNEVIVLDPGEAAPVLVYLAQQQLSLTAIWITHWHPDHIGGLAEILTHFSVPVLGHAATRGVTHPLDDGASFAVFAQTVQVSVLHTAGHTADHLVYLLNNQHLFPGDTLFSAGCGRVFPKLGGRLVDLYASLQKLAALPAETQVYCSHEYTLTNLYFAQQLEPNNQAIAERLQQVRAQRAAGKMTLPSNIANELATNPFLRCHTQAVHSAAEAYAGVKLPDAFAVFCVLREWRSCW